MGKRGFALIVHTLTLSGDRYGTLNSLQNPSLVILQSDQNERKVMETPWREHRQSQRLTPGS